MNASRSKIGRLPWDARNELNHRLNNGMTGVEAVAWVNAHPAFKALGLAPVNAQNMCEWRSGGFKAWEKQRRETDEIEQLAEFAKTIAERAGGSLTEVGQRLLMSHLLEVLRLARASREGMGEEVIERLSKAVGALAKTELDANKLTLDRRRLNLAEDAHKLDRERFEASVCEKLLDLYGDEKAREIATTNGLGRAAQIAMLREHLFADVIDPLAGGQL